MSNRKIVPQPPANLPAEWEPADASAMQALARGEATKEQQQRALNWVIYAAAGTYDLEYRTESRDHAFASGRRFVGLSIVKLLHLNAASIVAKSNISK